jgi:hypothetical protein
MRLRRHLNDGRAQVRSRAEGPRMPRPGGRGGRPCTLVRLATKGAAQRDPREASRSCCEEPSSRDLWAQTSVPSSLPRLLVV